jgi:hypothetical protein
MNFRGERLATGAVRAGMGCEITWHSATPVLHAANKRGMQILCQTPVFITVLLRKPELTGDFRNAVLAAPRYSGHMPLQELPVVSMN